VVKINKDIPSFQRIASYIFRAIYLGDFEGAPTETQSEGYTFTLDNNYKFI
jgi:hypothetical protein